ncbi:MAG TPA: ATP-binding protein [Vicinamibacterales bacterium]|nr:ATP-binding protein [Vicinamibacterales bacterium]
MKSAAARYTSSFSIIVAVLLLRLALQPWLGLSAPYLQFFPGIMLAAWLGGRGPGLFALALAALASRLFFLPPLFSFWLSETADRVSFPLFCLIGWMIVGLIDAARRAERAQRLAAERAEAHARELDAIFEAIPDAVYVGTAEGITQANAIGLRMVGAKSVEDLNRHIAALAQAFAVRSAETGDPIPVERLQFTRALQGEVVGGEVIARRADTGSDVVLRTSAAPIRVDGKVIGAVAINADVTEERRAAARLEEANVAVSRMTRRLADVVANVPGVVYEAWGQPDAASQRIDFVSDRVRTMLGYEPEEWTGTPNFWLSVVHPDDRVRAAAEARAIFESAADGRSEFRWLRKDGRVIWVEAHSSVIVDDAGRPAGMRGVTLDISSRKALERERATLLERAEIARADAVTANRLKDDFLATLSHELRTPLNAILGYARMLRQGIVEPARQAGAFEIVERNATALTQMVGDVLDVSSIIVGKIRLNVGMVDLPAVVEEAVATVRTAADAKGVRLQVTADPAAGPISGDPDRLQQIVWNLLSNAVRFTPKGGRVQVGVERVNSHVEIVVSDTGVGIHADFLPHVFERFRQADGRFSREYGGLGLGLAIARDLVELHGGTIHAFSDGEGRGATFRVELPRMIVDRGTIARVPPLPPLATDARQARAADLLGLRILSVDDDLDALKLMRDVLEGAGATVAVAHGGKEALDALSLAVPDVMITDLGMPQMDGFELLAAVRRSPDAAVQAMPVAALTAYARSDDGTRALRAGFQMHLAKPIDPAELVAAVASLARRPPAA